jgi:hypothetical protein
MVMILRTLVLTLVALSLTTCSAAEPVATSAKSIKFPLDLAILDPDAQTGADGREKPPFIVMFPAGKDKDGREVRGPLGRLEALRGQSKLFPESNDDDGLPVVLRGLRLHRQLKSDGSLAGYEVELQGEFNAVKVPVDEKTMHAFLDGQPATFSLQGQKNYGLFSYVSTTTLELQRLGEEIVVRKLEGDFSFREGLYTYTSKTLKLAPPAGRDYLYRGRQEKLPALPSI